MTRLLENKTVCATVFVLFTIAILVNLLAGGAMPAFGASPFGSSSFEQRADGPVFPPDPWDTEKDKVLVSADGPVFPPDPWDTEKDKKRA